MEIRTVTFTLKFNDIFTFEGNSVPSEIYVLPYFASFTHFDLIILSNMYIVPGTKNHFQKWVACRISKMYHGTNNI